MKKLIKELCQREGIKSQVKIGDVRELMKHFGDIVAEHEVNGEHSDLLQEMAVYVGKKIQRLRKKARGSGIILSE